MTRKTTPYARKRAQGKAHQRSDGITITRMHNTRLTPRELARIMEPCKAALKAMRSASANYGHFVTLCTAGHVAQAIEDGGIYAGQREIIEDANRALDAIGNRCGRTADQWQPRACYAPELAALMDLLAAHARQVHELTYGEYTAAADKAVVRVATDGGAVFYAEMSTS